MLTMSEHLLGSITSTYKLQPALQRARGKGQVYEWMDKQWSQQELEHVGIETKKQQIMCCVCCVEKIGGIYSEKTERMCLDREEIKRNG